MILFLDDEPWYILAYIESLELEGFSAKVIRDPEEFLEMACKSDDIKALVVDIVFPQDKILGLWVVEKVRNTKPEIPIILLTNRYDVTGIQQGLDEFTKVLSKVETMPSDLIKILKGFH